MIVGTNIMLWLRIRFWTMVICEPIFVFHRIITTHRYTHISDRKNHDAPCTFL